MSKELWLQLREKKRVCGPWKKGKAMQEDYKDSINLCREEIRKTKGCLELHLASAIKDSNKCFYKYISDKRRGKENLIFNGCRGTQRQRMRKMLRYLMPSLPQTLIARPAGVWVPTQVSWKN